MAKVIDVVTFNGEYDLFELRYQILKDYVDEFIIVEAPTTFSGKPKPLYSLESDKVFFDRFDQWAKVKVWIIDENYTPEEIALAESSPNTQGAEHWKREFLQKESIKKALTHLEDDDICFIGDVDEIWRPFDFSAVNIKRPFKLDLLVYTYYLNNRSSEKFSGTLVSPYKLVKERVLNHFRTQSSYWEIIRAGGWHFTSLVNGLERKLTDSYTKETYANDWVMNNLQENVAQNKDFLGRDFTYTIDESDWPQYLKDNRNKYKHLLK
jgi:hypothetical protein